MQLRVEGVRKRVLVGIVASMTLLSCSSSPSLYENLRAATEIAEEAKLPLILADATPFEWDEVFIFGPYTDREQVESKLRTPYPHGDIDELSDNDWHNLLVFREDGAVVHHELVTLGVDFSGIPSLLTPKSAVFDIREDGRAFRLTLQRG